MEKILSDIFQVLQNLFGQHRQLLEIVRVEREYLVQADHRSIPLLISRKQDVIEAIGQIEGQRLKLVADLASLWGKSVADLTLPKLILELQSVDAKVSEQFRSTYQGLTVLIQRITEQNQDNQKLIQRSLENVAEMKRNVLIGAAGKSGTYSNLGQRVGGVAARNLISREA